MRAAGSSVGDVRAHLADGQLPGHTVTVRRSTLVAGVTRRRDQERGLVVTVDAASDLEPLPAAVEVAAYHIVSEALTNVVKHARARECTVRLRRQEDALLVEVDDDGIGLASAYRAGAGLTTIRERASELGGEAIAVRGPTGGTVVQARLPLLGRP